MLSPATGKDGLGGIRNIVLSLVVRSCLYLIFHGLQHTGYEAVSVAYQDPEEVEASLLEKEEEVEAVEELLSAEQVGAGYQGNIGTAVCHNADQYWLG